MKMNKVTIKDYQLIEAQREAFFKISKTIRTCDHAKKMDAVDKMIANYEKKFGDAKYLKNRAYVKRGLLENLTKNL